MVKLYRHRKTPKLPLLVYFSETIPSLGELIKTLHNYFFSFVLGGRKIHYATYKI